MVKYIHQRLIEKIMLEYNESEIEKRERLGQEIENNIIEIMQLLGESIKHMVADENGCFHEKK
ncbi:hypothetical protein F4T82_12420 [Acinetobacter lwoffii]|uniref:hypothetical protein n=1 Tax=Acinetobacter lwoffii TaxID=28090 RepID=UPI0012985CD5|nr:hypothetical protein [Acinetobacter lwoffii]MRA04517.1 hypothetical protein [Acinetobacter lwoffii]